MAGLKEIKRRLVSVKNTKKITYAMKLVSAAKLRKAQEAVMNSREYSDGLNELLGTLLREGASSEFEHPLITPHNEVKKVRVLVIGASRGLCGGYNTNINRKLEAFYRAKAEAGISTDTVILSKKPAEYCRRTNRPYLQSYEALPEDANLWPIDEVCMSLEKDFIEGKVDEVYMIYTKFRSAISMTVMTERLLPLDAQSNAAADSKPVEGSTIYEPGGREVFSALMPRILSAKVRQAALDAKASEQGSRMTAMDSATKNAGDLIKKLTLLSNRLRQSGVTSQLLDILGGAEALES